MLTRLKDLLPGITGLRATGTVTRQDYEGVFEPLVEQARREGRRLRFLYEMGPDCGGYTPSAAWEDAMLGLRSTGLFDAFAVVSDLGWVRESTWLINLLIPCPVHVFWNQERDRAVDWLLAQPSAAAASHRLVPELGVIVLELEAAPQAHDTDALALSADAWSAVHGDLQGVVVHARGFPACENLASFVRHAQYVRDHHRKVRRVALAADGKIAHFLADLVGPFVEAEVKSFAHDDLESAIQWAGPCDGAQLPLQTPREVRA